jgi:uncharacterized protein (UPF0335 family)
MKKRYDMFRDIGNRLNQLSKKIEKIEREKNRINSSIEQLLNEFELFNN